jgi:hypothetical protein
MRPMFDVMLEIFYEVETLRTPTVFSAHMRFVIINL